MPKDVWTFMSKIGFNKFKYTSRDITYCPFRYEEVLIRTSKEFKHKKAVEDHPPP